MAVQKWEYCSLTIDHLEDRQVMQFTQYKLKGTIQRVIEPDEFGRFVAQLGRDGWELAGVSSDQPPPPGARYREGWVFKRPLRAAR